MFIIADNKAKLVDIETGLSDDKNIAVIKGLSTGDVVITAGASQVMDGDQQHAGIRGARPATHELR